MSRTYRIPLELSRYKSYLHNRQYKIEIWKFKSSSINQISTGQKCLYINEDFYTMRVRDYSHRYPNYTNPRYHEQYPAAIYEKKL